MELQRCGQADRGSAPAQNNKLSTNFRPDRQGHHFSSLKCSVGILCLGRRDLQQVVIAQLHPDVATPLGPGGR
jgi:hypothetical protein